MATGDLRLLGTLYTGNTKRLWPTNPVNGGNITAFAVGQAIEIRDSDTNNSAYQLRWRELLVGAKKLLIADRNILHSVSWDDLNAQGLVFGKEITIDGQRYKLRLLTGGSNYRNTSDAHAGGTPTANEWDQIISGEANYAGLPKPSAADLANNLANRNSAHNQFWNWYSFYSWAQETYTEINSLRAIRGNSSVRHWYYNSSSNRGTILGWRPVLEVLNTGPTIKVNDSETDQDLGEKTNYFSSRVNIGHPEQKYMSMVIKLNGIEIDSDSGFRATSRPWGITLDQWMTLALNVKHTITIEATDSDGVKSTRTLTFTKTNATPTAIAVEPKGDLTNIKIVDTTAPIAVWRFEDIDPNDRQSAYRLLVWDLSDNIVHDSGKKISTQSFYAIPDVLEWGGRYKWQVVVYDKYDVPSRYSFPEFFMPNRPPSATNLQPGSNDADNPVGAGMAPEYTWDFEDLDLEAQTAYQLKIFKVSDDSLAYDTSRVNRNLQTHKVPVGVLAEGTAYYAILTVWDPNNLSGETERAYIVTNATPSAPILTGPIDNYRTTNRPTLHGLVGTDPEDDGMHFAVQIARDAEFTKNVVTLRSDTDRTGWQVGGYDIPEVGVKNDQEGQALTYTLQFDLDTNRHYFWRFAGIDASTKAVGVYSQTRKIRSGNELIFTIKKPINTASVAARRILFAADYQLPTDGTNKATIKVEFTNNALDVSPTWEDATAQFKSMDYYNFTNTTKTATNFAIGVRLTIKANDAMAPISIDAIGLTFD